MSRSFRTILRLGRWELVLWTHRWMWHWLPTVRRYWSGKIIYRKWLCFSLVHDMRVGRKRKGGGR